MVIRDDRFDFEFQGSAEIRIKSDSVRVPDTNGGFDGSALYVGNVAAARQFRFASYDASFPHLYLEANVGSSGTPNWSNPGSSTPQPVLARAFPMISSKTESAVSTGTFGTR